MKRCLISVLAALLLTTLSGCGKTTYEKTVSRVDVGGKVLIYREHMPCGETFRKGNNALKSLLLKKTQGFQQFAVSSASDFLNVLFDAANPDALQASAFSVSGEGNGAPWHLRSFSYLGKNPPSSVFDLIPRKNRSFEFFSQLPEETVLSIGGFGCYAPFWKNLRAAAERGKNQQIRLILEIAESQVQQLFGVSMEEFLQGLEGEQQLFLTWNGKTFQFKLVVSDSKELLRKAFSDYAAQEEIRKLDEGDYALDIEQVKELGWDPRLRFRKGSMTFVTSPGLFQSPAKPMSKSAVWAPYLKDLPQRGVGYAVLRISNSMMQKISGTVPEAASLLQMIPETVIVGVMERERDGIACTASSSLMLSPDDPAWLPLAGAAAGMLSQLTPDVPEKAPNPAANAAVRTPGKAPAAPAAEKTEVPAVPPAPQKTTAAMPPSLPDDAGVAISCRGSMKRIMTSLLLYAGAHHDAFPQTSGAQGLYELVENGYADPAMFRCSADKHPIASRRHESSVSYYYFGGCTLEEARKAPNTPLLIEKPEIHVGNFTHVLFADGHWEKLELDKPYTSLKQALECCLSQHPIAPQAAAQLRAKLPQE